MHGSGASSEYRSRSSVTLSPAPDCSCAASMRWRASTPVSSRRGCRVPSRAQYERVERLRSRGSTHQPQARRAGHLARYRSRCSFGFPGTGGRHGESCRVPGRRGRRSGRTRDRRKPVRLAKLLRDAPGSALGWRACRRPSSQAERQAGLEAMVNRSFADRYFPGRSVLGLQLRSEGAAAARIVGIVGDARELGLDRNPVATVYACDSAMTPFGAFLVRTIGDPVSVVSPSGRRSTSSSRSKPSTTSCRWSSESRARKRRTGCA